MIKLELKTGGELTLDCASILSLQDTAKGCLVSYMGEEGTKTVEVWEARVRITKLLEKAGVSHGGNHE